MRSRIRHAAVAFALALGSVLLTAGAVEGALHLIGPERVYYHPLHAFHVNDPVLGYRGRPNVIARFAVPGRFNVLVRHDARGFRVQECEKPVAAVLKNLTAYGDSFTWGWGVDQGEGFTDILNRDPPDWRVHNRGINASGTVLQYTLFETEDIQDLSPGDAVIIMFCFNDYRDDIGQEDEVTGAIVDGRVVRVPPQKNFQSPVRAFLRQHVYLYSMGSAIVANLRRRFESTSDSDMVPLLDESDPAVIVTSHFLAEFNKQCEGHGLRFCVAVIPAALEYGEPACGFDPATAAAYRELITGILDNEGIDCLDLLAYFLDAKKANPDTLLTIPGDNHWNASGHEVVARAITDALRDEPGAVTR